jgi:hypothetical protein
MVEYEITIPDFAGHNLAAAYVQARQHQLIPAMQKSVQAAQTAARGMIPVGATGEARRSVCTSVAQIPAWTIGKVTSTMRRPTIYIYVLNAGRPAGKKQPPVAGLVPWVMAKGLASDGKQAAKVAYLIARSIQRRGKQGLSFQWQGLEHAKPAIDAAHAQAVNNIIQELENAA